MLTLIIVYFIYFYNVLYIAAHLTEMIWVAYKDCNTENPTTW